MRFVFQTSFLGGNLPNFLGFGGRDWRIISQFASTKHIIGYDESDDKIVYDVRAAYIEPFPSEPWLKLTDAMGCTECMRDLFPHASCVRDLYIPFERQNLLCFAVAKSKEEQQRKREKNRPCRQGVTGVVFVQTNHSQA